MARALLGMVGLVISVPLFLMGRLQDAVLEDVSLDGLISLFFSGIVASLVLIFRRPKGSRSGSPGVVGHQPVTCPSCGQRTVPGAGCQWCDEPLGAEGERTVGVREVWGRVRDRPSPERCRVLSIRACPGGSPANK